MARMAAQYASDNGLIVPYIYAALFWLIVCAEGIVYQSMYYDTQIERFYVPKGRAKWKVPLPGYNPVVYNAKCTYSRGCDPDYLNGSIEFNKETNTIDRRSSVKTYDLDIDGYPLNPKGRTGILGRGVLPRYGPNHQIVAIFTRGSQPVEYLASSVYQNNSMEYLGLIAEIVDRPSLHRVPPKLLKKFRAYLVQYYSHGAVEDLIQAALRNCLKHYKGFVADERNTDNAWVESTIYEFIDQKVSNFGLVEMEQPNNSMELTWIELKEETMTARLMQVASRADMRLKERIRNGFFKLRSSFMKKSRKDKAKAGSAAFAILITIVATAFSLASFG